MASQEAAIERLQMAVIDGRTENIRYRQTQLRNLHSALRNEAASMCSALAKDSQTSNAEVETEYYLAMEAVRHFYDSLNFEEEYMKKYSITNGKDNTSRRLGVGLVVIRPTSHTRFYSIITPLAAAISAGNCIVLELEDNLLQVDAVLRKILPAALDINSFCLSKTIRDSSILEIAVLVDQTSTASSRSLTAQLCSSSITRTVAIVDRTADLQVAAKAITQARFSFGGTSPYAPDLVLVNEFVKEEFFEACSKYATLAFAKDSAVKKVNGNRSEDSRKAVAKAEERRQVASFGSNDFKLVQILDKSTSLMKMKISGRYLPIATCSGLIDAIFNQQFENPLLAGYFFADPKSAKYLAQHLLCHISCINQIPIHLLVGPAAPMAHDADFSYRYSKDMLSVARPQYVEPPAEAFAMAKELLDGSKKTSTSKIRALAIVPLKPTGQPANDHLGFFEAGLVTMGSIVLAIILPIVGFGTWIAARKGVAIASRWRN
ncbi:Aldehyde/histidinol dehydrogenase [Pseudomassariella vexata]|uniref:Aldehyde/histidinol dehydrogenase n=1 Tax=Pseudomassariella vexata TaxID=1141098 RepID=A0A1Y2EJV6_9PEZI|nr:Aldehyde/histidinol dehydrogenase [Pseudomassariella vexata]ORY71829.1 Aldehyde/histidinol dehydrogenase [Pseudomassariella vexata]